MNLESLENGNINLMSEADRARLAILERKEAIIKSRQSTKLRNSMRELILLIDYSAQMDQEEQDYKPSPSSHIANLLRPFITKFFEQNPLSKLSQILLIDQKAHILTKLDNNVKVHLAALKQLKSKKAAVFENLFAQNANHRIDFTKNEGQIEPSGVISQKNGQDICHKELSLSALYFSKEILMVLGSSGTKDPGNCGMIYETIEKQANGNIVANILSIKSRVYIYNQIAEKTGGFCEVMKNSINFDQRFLSLANSCERKEELQLNTRFMVSFPKLQYSDMPVLCACHKQFKKIGYECSFCLAWNCEMPSTCAVCKIPLITAMQIVRSQNNDDVKVETDIYELKPPENSKSQPKNTHVQGSDDLESQFKNLSISNNLKSMVIKDKAECTGCQKVIAYTKNSDNGAVLEGKNLFATVCTKCEAIYCTDCDFFINESLKFCPNCPHGED